jgi:hypothetical protein
VAATYTGKIADGAMKGEGDWGGTTKVQWTARRPAARPANGPRTHVFAPTEFHRTFSYAIPPALRIFPGDTVQTKSIDAAGTDESSVRRSFGGDPLTGPFFIEGAIPGDTLVIKLNRVRTNRDWAWSGQLVVGNALARDYLMNLKRNPNFNSGWKLDKQKGIAYLHPLLNFREIPLLARQMRDAYDPLLGLTTAENMRAIEAGIAAQQRWLNDMRQQARSVLDRLESEGRFGIVMLGTFNRHLIRDLEEINLSLEIRQALDAQRMKLAAIEIPAKIDIATREAIRRSIDKSFVAGFRVVMLIASGLALASAATAWLVIR